MSGSRRGKSTGKVAGGAKGYVHAGTEAVARPAVGAAPRFRGKKAPATYRYDSSLSPALEWDSNPAREVAGFLMGCIEEAAGLADRPGRG